MSDNVFDFDSVATDPLAGMDFTTVPRTVRDVVAGPTDFSADMAAGLDRVDEVDPDAVSTDSAPPPPAGRYRLRIKHVDGAAATKPKRVPGFTHDNVTSFVYPEGQTQLVMFLDYQLLDENGADLGRSRRYFPNTMQGRNVKVSEIDTICKCLKVPYVGRSIRAKVLDLSQAIDGGRDLINVDIDWELVETEGHENDKGKKVYDTFLRGMTRFPSVVVGGKTFYKPLDADPASGTPARTQWAVVKYIP